MRLINHGAGSHVQHMLDLQESRKFKHTQMLDFNRKPDHHGLFLDLRVFKRKGVGSVRGRRPCDPHLGQSDRPAENTGWRTLAYGFLSGAMLDLHALIGICS